MRFRHSALIPAIACLLAAGCTRLSADRGLGGKVTLVPLTYAQWQEKLAGYKGNIVVIDLWATWCAPCIERFPHLVELSKRYGNRTGIKFVSMSFDDPSDRSALELALNFLIRQQAFFDNYRMDEIIPDAFDKFNIQGIPAVFIYDGDGKLRYRLTGDDPNRQFTNDDVDRAVRSLLAEGQKPVNVRSDIPN